jgi:hypothetical protein
MVSCSTFSIAQCLSEFGTNFKSYENFSGYDDPDQIRLGQKQHSEWNGTQYVYTTEVANENGSTVLDTLGIKATIQNDESNYDSEIHVGIGYLSFFGSSLIFDFSNYGAKRVRISMALWNNSEETTSIKINNQMMSNYVNDSIQYLSDGTVFSFFGDSMSIEGPISSLTLDGFEFIVYNFCIESTFVTNTFEINLNDFSVSQTSQSLIINSEGDLSEKQIRIYNTTGSVVYLSNYIDNQIDISHLPANVYFVRIGNVTKKILVTK